MGQALRSDAVSAPAGRRYARLVAAICVAAALPQQASAASFVYNFTDTQVGAFGSGPFGSVTVTEGSGANAGKLDFLVSLSGGLRFRNPSDSNHTPFAFSIASDPTIVITNLSSWGSPLALTSGTSVAATPFGNFFTGIDYPGGDAGYDLTDPNTLSFTVAALNAQSQSISLSLASLASNLYEGKQIYFAADVGSPSGNTGSIGATFSGGGGGSTPPVPEPATWAMMILGLGFVGAMMRRKQSATVRYRFA